MSGRAAKAGGLTLAQRDKLARVLGMLGSDHAGERAAAGLLADKMVRGQGLEWANLLAASHQPRNAPLPPNWRGIARGCLCWPELLTVADLGFLNSIVIRPPAALSDKQARWLADCVRRIRSAGAGL